MKKNIKDYLFFKKLCNLPFIETIYLFGSRARGDAQERSDIDLAIECPSATAAEWNEIMKIIWEADTLLKIDCLRMDSLKNKDLFEDIQKHKKILYRRSTP